MSKLRFGAIFAVWLFVCLVWLAGGRPVWGACGDNYYECAATTYCCTLGCNPLTDPGCECGECNPLYDPGCSCQQFCGNYSPHPCFIQYGVCFGACLGVECARNTENCNQPTPPGPTATPGGPPPTQPPPAFPCDVGSSKVCVSDAIGGSGHDSSGDTKCPHSNQDGYPNNLLHGYKCYDNHNASCSLTANPSSVVQGASVDLTLTTLQNGGNDNWYGNYAIKTVSFSGASNLPAISPNDFDSDPPVSQVVKSWSTAGESGNKTITATFNLYGETYRGSGDAIVVSCSAIVTIIAPTSTPTPTPTAVIVSCSGSFPSPVNIVVDGQSVTIP